MLSNKAGGKVNFNICSDVDTECTDIRSLFVQREKCNLLAGSWTKDKEFELDRK